MRPFLLMLFASACLGNTPDPAGIVRRSVSRDQDNWKLARDYTFVRRVEERTLGKHGRIERVEARTEEVMVLYGRPYERLIEIDGKPLDPARERAEREKLAKESERRRREFESGEKRRKREAEFEKERERRRQFLREVPDAYGFRLAGEEVIEGRQCWVIDADPKAGYRPRDERAGKFLTHMRGRLWIDKDEYEWVRAEAESLDTVSFGWFLARIGKGAQFTFEQKKINDEIWLPRAIRFRFDARLGMVKSLHREVEISFRDYRKFQSESRVVSTSELPEP